MTTITLNINEKNIKGKNLLNFLKSLNGESYIQVDTNSNAEYDPKFVDKIRKSEKEKSHKVDIKNLWK